MTAGAGMSISIGRLARRPEAGSLVGLIVIYVFFAILGGQVFLGAPGWSSWLNMAAEVGFISLPVGLLMIAGELDISDAADRGIATVHQFGGTFPLMSIGRSFFVGVEPTKRFGPFHVFDRKTANETAVKAVREFGITRIDDGERLVGGLSGGERQSLAIARAVHFGAKVLILDEPTAALGVKQASHVLRIVLEARKRGLAVIFITRQVIHAMAVGDHYAVLIRGALAANFMRGQKTREEITDLMAGGEALANLDAEIEDHPHSPGGRPSATVA
jgi:simple sugar transport system ATP-binding protein